VKLWIDGGIRPDRQASISTQDRGLLLGDGLFETIRVAAGAAAHLARHLARLRMGAGVLGIPVPMDQAALGDALGRVIAANALSEGSLRLTLTRGSAARGVLPPEVVTPTLMITASHGGAASGGATVVTASITRRNEQSPLSRIKSLNYLDSILARREAASHGADEAILLNTHGAVAEASCANLLVLADGGLVTPRIEDGALGGVVRACLIEQGAVRERHLLPDDLREAEALFLCNSLGVRAVLRLDGRPVPSRPDCLGRLRRMINATGHRPG